MDSSGLRYRLENQIDAIVQGALAAAERLSLLEEGFLPHALDRAADLLMDDLMAFAQRDPAAHGRPQLILDAACSFQAVLYYRLAHEFWQLRVTSDAPWDVVALKLAALGKLDSGADIHPGARIGSRLVLDHAYGTVIGETCRIGNDAYILGGVTLGSQGIANNPPGQRHPILGNNVQVGAFARVLGAITIGDNVFISPGCVVTENIPGNSRVSIVNQLQVERQEQQFPRRAPRFIGSYADNNRLIALCQGFSYLTATLLDDQHRPMASTTLSPSPEDPRRYEIQFGLSAARARTLLDSRLHLTLSDSGSAITLLSPQGLNEVIARIALTGPHLANKENLSHDCRY